MSSATSIVPRRRKPRRIFVRIRDVSLSDFMTISGSPLEWVLAWEAIAERERVAREVEAARASQTAALVAV
jgi:hypothetical protein